MSNQILEARQYIAKAREALQRGDKTSARQLGEQAALLAPNMEDTWLILAASDPDPQDALAYAQKARELNPKSPRAHRAVEWATARLKQVEALKERVPVSPLIAPRHVDAVTRLPEKHAYQQPIAAPPVKSSGRKWLLPAILTGAICILFGLAAVFVLTSPALASLVSRVSVPVSTQENLWAPAEIAKPEATPVDDNTVALAPADTATDVPTDVPATAVPTDPPTEIPSANPTEAPTLEEPAPAVTETPGALAMELVEDEDVAVSEYIPATPAISMSEGVRWIDVDLTNQMVYAYEGDVLVNSFLVSTGTWLTPTVTGKHKIYVKVRMQDMSGPGYHLKDVPYVMFFYGDYGLHGTYWHNNFGTPMSRGCVNLTIDDAAWLFNWASVGTVVNVHY